MSSTDVRNQTSAEVPAPGVVDMNLEVIVLGVADVDKAKAFYANLGWRLDADVTRGEDFRLVQFTPPGSGCSVQFGINLTSAAPGSGQSPYLIVSDVEAARADLVARVWTSARCSTRVRPALDSTKPPGWTARRPIVVAMARTPPSAIPTATAGCSKRSRHGCPAASTRRRPPSCRRATWLGRFGVRRPPTASTRSGSARQTPTGRIGTPSTWWPSGRATNCRPDPRRRRDRRRWYGPRNPYRGPASANGFAYPCVARAPQDDRTATIEKVLMGGVGTPAWTSRK